MTGTWNFSFCVASWPLRKKSASRAIKEPKDELDVVLLARTTPSYQHQVATNARAMVAVLQQRGYKIVSGGTDNHLMLIDLSSKPYTGEEADAALSEAYITTNKNTVPNDPRSPFVTSGLRIGTPAVTTRGFGVAECEQLAGWLCDVLEAGALASVTERVWDQVVGLCRRHPGDQ